jgi:hypothetical protein
MTISAKFLVVSFGVEEEERIRKREERTKSKETILNLIFFY